eukprot:m.487750 g.487750  ORF g.487750 m.487750 type:complete len:659 (+) comp25235_c0_seq1:56-2032(+)
MSDDHTEEEAVDTLDLIVLTIAVAALLLFLINKFRGGKMRSRAPSVASSEEVVNDHEGNLALAMKNASKNTLVIYGSQTGTAEEFAGRLAQDARGFGLKPFVVDPQEFDMSTLEDVREIEDALVLIAIATYGEGDPTDNAQEWIDMLNERELNLDGLRFAVFGLGNSTYEQFNSMGLLVDKMLDAFKGKRLTDVGLGDDDKNIDDDFVVWKDGLWPKVCEEFGIDPEGHGNEAIREFKAKEFSGSEHRVFTGEMGSRGSYERQRRPFNLKNPFLAPIAEKSELFTCEDRSCLHVEFDITGSGIRYRAGDHVAIYAANQSKLVEAIGARLGVNLDTVVRFKAVDEYATKKSPFPSPCSYRTALMHYVDITSTPHPHVLRMLGQYAEDEAQAARIEHLTSKEGREDYLAWIQERCILDLLEEFSSVQPDINHLLEVLPRLQPRYYSISSSPKKSPTRIHVTASVVRYENKHGHKREGVATSFLDRATTGTDRVPIFVRESTFRLPSSSKDPVIMIGPGTGLAPFRGFLQERAFHKENGKELGHALLFFGCQYEAKHFMYADELRKYHADGIMQLHTAFSRDQPHKVYVTHRLEEQRALLWDLLSTNGHIYVCGDAKNMARDVHNILLSIFEKEGGMSEKEAEAHIKELSVKKRYQLDVWS